MSQQTGSGTAAVTLSRAEECAQLIAKAGAVEDPRYDRIKAALDRFYGMLTILDTKATGLLTINTLFGAILAVVQIDKEFFDSLAGKLILGGEALLTAISAFYCLLIVGIEWPFLAGIPPAPKDEKDFDFELRRLADVIIRRCAYYKKAWWLTMAVFVLGGLVWGIYELASLFSPASPKPVTT